MYIIGFTGNAQVGKTTSATYLQGAFKSGDSYNLSDIRSFASGLKQTAKAIYPSLNLDKKEEIDPEVGKSPRQVLQILGTDIARKIDSKTWTRMMVNQLKEDKKRLSTVMIDDIRFMNEYECLVEFEQEDPEITFRFVGIERPGKAPKWYQRPHASEKHIKALYKKADHIILNNGTMEELYEQLDSIWTLFDH